MNDALLLVNSISLLYCSSLLPDVDDYRSLVKSVVADIKQPPVVMGERSESSTIAALKSTALSMCNDPPSTKYEKVTFTQRIKVDTKDSPELYEAFENVIGSELTEEHLKEICTDLSRILSAHFKDKEVEEIIQKASYKIKFEKDKLGGYHKFVSELVGKLEPYQISNDKKKKDPAIVGAVSFLDVNSIKNVFTNIDNEDNGDGILKTGYQALNRMLQGGFRPGDEVSCAALPHNYKTGFSLSIFRGVAQHNIPFLIDKKKKPLLLRISFEDKIEANVDFLFRALKHNELKGREFEYSSITDEQKALYVQKELTKTGFYIEMLRVDPTQWTYRDIINKCMEYEAMGYEIKMLMLDYLAMVPTTGCTEGPTGSDVRDMYRRIRNYFSP